MKVLMIGGTGLISTAVVEESLHRGIDVFLLNRGKNKANFSRETHQFIADINDEDVVKKVIGQHTFDVIVDFIAFKVEDVKRDYRLFKNKTKQYVFISSASAYQKPLPKLPITEDIPLDNKFWKYSQNKKYCEEFLLQINDPGFNVTIIRPSHTYSNKSLIFQLKSGKHPFTLIDRMLNHKPIIIPDDGLSKWTLTYHKDFAKGFVDVLGNKDTYQNYYHLTSEKVYTWNQIVYSIYDTLQITPHLIYIPTSEILKVFPEFEGELYGDKYEDAIFDNAKIKSVAPNYTSKTEYTSIVKQVISYYLSHKEEQTVDYDFIDRYDKLIDNYKE